MVEGEEGGVVSGPMARGMHRRQRVQVKAARGETPESQGQGQGEGNHFKGLSTEAKNEKGALFHQ